MLEKTVYSYVDYTDSSFVCSGLSSCLKNQDRLCLDSFPHQLTKEKRLSSSFIRLINLIIFIKITFIFLFRTIGSDAYIPASIHQSLTYINTFIIIFIILEIMNPEIIPKTVQYLHPSEQQWKIAKSDICLHQILGDVIDLNWQLSSGILRISKSTSSQFEYCKNQESQIFKSVKFRHHPTACPLLSQKLIKNPQRNMKPCACVLLVDENKKQFLATQRSPKLLFPYAWVLPGGHLEPKQGVFEGGIRECEEEVGLPKKKGKQTFGKEMMVWESVATVDEKIKATAIVIFFSAVCEEFQVKMDKNQVIDWKWKNFKERDDEVEYDRELKTGYALGHLTYLSLLRENMSFD